MFIRQGFGYWDTTTFPAGGDFRRAARDTPCDVLRTLKWKGQDHSEVRINTPSGPRKALVRHDGLAEYVDQ